MQFTVDVAVVVNILGYHIQLTGMVWTAHGDALYKTL